MSRGNESRSEQTVANTRLLHRLWESSDGYDVVIVCGELRWYVHRHVLERMSEYMQEYLPLEAEDVSLRIDLVKKQRCPDRTQETLTIFVRADRWCGT